ncbi:hypothetical protein NLI96_g8768 [Meripilus lineatus]|uniref:DUF6535 domain-containing protein n=1 Tax=Meripilus lineatus TaxID=2056292 RepID=A0AAD5YFZ6_9APHY|nr:hypothetical protein NLI96_g8768 [Physisporinus lineatus]
MNEKRLLPNTSWQVQTTRDPLPCPPTSSHTAIPQSTSGIEMSTDVEMTTIESTTRRSPSPSKKSGRSGSSPANSRRRSSSSKRKRSLENKIEEVSRRNEHETHDAGGDDEAVDRTEEPSSSSNLPGGSNPVHTTGPSSQGPAATQQSNSTSEAQTPSASSEGDEKEGLTQVEEYCIQKEKLYPDIALKPEDTNAWPELWDTLAKHDGDQSKAHYQNMDTLLVLSGLFSAVVTTLLVEANSRLQQDPADATVQILLNISMQLSSLSVTSGFINSTYIPPQPLPFTPAPSAVVISILWSLSLVISLVTASLGMLVKQWLREYHSKANVSPEQCCQIRMFRAPGLRKYKVAEIADFLPILLQIALILFFIGLILSYRSIHTSIANAVTIVVAIWLFFVVGTTFLPIISPSCPYKTPLLKSVFSKLRGFLAQGRNSFGSYLALSSQTFFSFEEPTKVMNDEYEEQGVDERIRDFPGPSNPGIIVKSDLRGLFDQAQLRILLKGMTACLRRASFVALQDGERAWFRSTEVVHFVTLRKLRWAFRSSGGSDAALNNIVDRLTQHKHAFSVPHHSNFTSFYGLLYQGDLELPSLPLKKIDRDEMREIILWANRALNIGSGTGAGFKRGTSLPHLLDTCRISFLCAGRATEAALDWRKSEFLQLTVRLAESLQSISYPERRVDTTTVFGAQCALDMAMRFHTKVPGFVDKSLFQALHVCSMKMLDLEVKDRPLELRYHIRTRNNALSTGEVPGSVSGADWEEVLEGKEYVGFRILDDGNDRDEWYHEDLQSSCKQRIQFMWSKIQWRGIFSRILDDFRIE